MGDIGDNDGVGNVDGTSGPRTQRLRHEDAGSPRVVESSALLDGRSQLAILHNETVYFLRQTRFGKLILTK
jgi:hemin uptake protein HemP